MCVAWHGMTGIWYLWHGYCRWCAVCNLYDIYLMVMVDIWTDGRMDGVLIYRPKAEYTSTAWREHMLYCIALHPMFEYRLCVYIVQ